MLYSELYALTFWVARVLGVLEDVILGYGFESLGSTKSLETKKRRRAKKVRVPSRANGRSAKKPTDIA